MYGCQLVCNAGQTSVLTAASLGAELTAESGSGHRASCTRTPWPVALHRCTRRRSGQCAGAAELSEAPPLSGSPAGSTHWHLSGSVVTHAHKCTGLILVETWMDVAEQRIIGVV